MYAFEFEAELESPGKDSQLLNVNTNIMIRRDILPPRRTILF
jgi:hypothetical protein